MLIKLNLNSQLNNVNYIKLKMFITVVEIENRGIITGFYATGDEACLQVEAHIKKTEPGGLEHDFEVLKKDFPNSRFYEIKGNYLFANGIQFVSDGVCGIYAIDLKDEINGLELFVRERENTSFNLDLEIMETLSEKYQMEELVFAN